MKIRVGDYDLEAFEREETEVDVDTILVHQDYEWVFRTPNES